MALITFEDLPSTNTPINANNLNNNFNYVFYKDNMSFNNYSNLATLSQDIYINKFKNCIGNIGSLNNTNLKVLLGDPNIGNYTRCVFEHIIGEETEGCIRVTAFGPYTSNIRIGYIIYDSSDSRFTGWKNI